MMIKDFFKFAIISIRHRKLRSWLTITGIVIGVAAVISLIAIGQGMQSSIATQLERLGPDKLIIIPGGGGIFGAVGGISVGDLTEDDADLISNIKEVQRADGLIFKIAKISYKGETAFNYVIGVPTAPESTWVLEHLEVEGRYLKESDRYKAVVGYNYPETRAFEKAVKVGDPLDIENQTFKIVGSLQEIGNQADDNQVYIPIDVARELFDEPTKYNFIYAKVKKGYDPEAVAPKIEDALRHDRNLKKGEEDFSVQTAKQLVDAFKNILGIIQAILVGIASVALLVGGVGIMNTMFTSVLERTHEIGVMKATGAKNSDVRAIFLIESGLLGLVGGLLGISVGIILAKGAEYYASFIGYPMLKASVTPSLILFSLLFSFVLGALAGFLPARQASKLKPADALRHE